MKYLNKLNHFPVVLWMLLISGIVQGQNNIYPYADSTGFGPLGFLKIDQNYSFIPLCQAFQADHKILVAGYGKKNAQSAFDAFIYRTTEDGKLDETFADNGTLRIDIDGASDWIESVVVLPDQKILLLINNNPRIFLVRLLSDGSPDPSFGVDGILLTDATDNETANDMTIQPDGKILIVGYNLKQGKYVGMLRRLKPDGSSDQNFGTNGYAQANIDANQYLEFNKCLVQPDGKILVTGPYGTGTSSGYPLFRFTSEGVLDPGFSGDGIFFKQMGNNTITATAYTLGLNTDGSIIVGGYAPANTIYPTMAAIKVKPGGTIDGSFGAFGIARADFGGSTFANDMVIQPNGKIIVGGMGYTTDTSCIMAIARLNSDGKLDNSWGYQGKFLFTYVDADFDLEFVKVLNLDHQNRLVVTTWHNEAINTNDLGRAACTISRFFVGQAVPAMEEESLAADFRVFPNPVNQEQVTLTYTLKEAADVSIYLQDMNGSIIAELCSENQQQEGRQSSRFNLPDGLHTGIYNLLVRAGSVMHSVLIFKG